MPNRKKPGEIADESGEYIERGERGGKVPKPREVTIDRGEKLPPTQKPKRKWERKKR